MLWPFVLYGLLLALVMLMGWAGGQWQAAALAAVAVAWLQALWQWQRGRRFLAWLKNGGLTPPPQLSGHWQEAGERAFRLAAGLRESLQASELRLQEFLGAIQASPYGLVLLDGAGRIEWCNLTAAQHLGFDPQRDRLQYVGNLVREPDFLAYWTQRRFRHEISMAGRQGDTAHPHRLALQIHPYGQGKHLLLTRDVTVVEQAETMRRDFVANVSHEIRTPLTVLCGFIETLQTLDLDEAGRQRYLTLMAEQGQRMLTLVQDLLTLSRLEGSPPPGLSQWVDVESLTGRCVQDAQALSQMVSAQSQRTASQAQPSPPPGHAAHAVCASVQPPGLEIAGDMAEIHSALSNLLSNAVRYTPPGGQIGVRWLKDEQGCAVCQVSDTGLGIEARHLPRLTERFYRVDRSRSRESGATGLGLAIVKHVVQRHGGQLQIESTPGQGSCFTLVFPAMRVRG